MVFFEKIDGGGYRISRVLPCLASAAAAAAAIEAVVPLAYQPSAVEIAVRDGVTADGAGVIPHDVAAAILRDQLAGDDEGAPGEPPRCKTGGCE